MTKEEAIRWLTNEKWTNANIKYKKEWNEAFDLAIEALSAEEAVWNEYEAEFTDLPDIPRYYYEKVVGKMAHEINMLKEQLESAEAEWIPVSERLPEDGVEVLITTENEEVYIDQVITDPYKERYFQSNTGYDNFQVIAWMPLPKPYKGGGAE